MRQIVQNARGDSVCHLTFRDLKIQVGTENTEQAVTANYYPMYALLKAMFLKPFCSDSSICQSYVVCNAVTRHIQFF